MKRNSNELKGKDDEIALPRVWMDSLLGMSGAGGEAIRKNWTDAGKMISTWTDSASDARSLQSGSLDRTLVVASMQMGKTLHMQCLIGRALLAAQRSKEEAGSLLGGQETRCFRIDWVVVVAGTACALRVQTQQRMDMLQWVPPHGEGGGSDQLEWLTTTARDVSQLASNKRRRKGDGIPAMPSMGVILKNVQTLRKMIAWVRHERRPEDGLLLINDECDHASVNYHGADEPPSRTYEQVAALWAEFPPGQRQYVGYTATPQANLFERAQHSLLLPQRLHLLPAYGEGAALPPLYRGLENWDFERHVRVVPERAFPCYAAHPGWTRAELDRQAFLQLSAAPHPTPGNGPEVPPPAPPPASSLAKLLQSFLFSAFATAVLRTQYEEQAWLQSCCREGQEESLEDAGGQGAGTEDALAAVARALTLPHAQLVLRVASELRSQMQHTPLSWWGLDPADAGALLSPTDSTEAGGQPLCAVVAKYVKVGAQRPWFITSRWMQLVCDAAGCSLAIWKEGNQKLQWVGKVARRAVHMSWAMTASQDDVQETRRVRWLRPVGLPPKHEDPPPSAPLPPAVVTSAVVHVSRLRQLHVATQERLQQEWDAMMPHLVLGNTPTGESWLHQEWRALAHRDWNEVDGAFASYLMSRVRIVTCMGMTRSQRRRVGPDPIQHVVEEQRRRGGGLVVWVGGDVLGRGVTFPGLLTQLYLRESRRPTWDTMAQALRIAGWKGERERGLLRLWVQPAQLNHLRNLQRQAWVLRTQLRAIVRRALPLSRAPVVLPVYAPMQCTRREKRRDAVQVFWSCRPHCFQWASRRSEVLRKVVNDEQRLRAQARGSTCLPIPRACAWLESWLEVDGEFLKWIAVLHAWLLETGGREVSLSADRAELPQLLWEHGESPWRPPIVIMRLSFPPSLSLQKIRLFCRQ